jgi:all-trans-retinol dehydrogenase (NAD+)
MRTLLIWITAPSAVFYSVDLSSLSAIREVAARIKTEHGNPTVLINNAAVANMKLILDETEEEITRAFSVNIISQFLLVKEFLPAMIKKNHGHVLNVASVSSYIPHAQNVGYASTKAAALAFHEGLTTELKTRYKADKVRTRYVNRHSIFFLLEMWVLIVASIIHPGWIRTPMLDKVLANPNFNEFVLEPETVADAIVEQVLSGLSSQVLIPRRLATVSFLRGLPSWLQLSMRAAMAHVFVPEKTSSFTVGL